MQECGYKLLRRTDGRTGRKKYKIQLITYYYYERGIFTYVGNIDIIENEWQKERVLIN
jgi:transposase-like protein